jgi:hypothetical protein
VPPAKATLRDVENGVLGLEVGLGRGPQLHS